MTREEALALANALQARGFLEFPVSHGTGGLICGAVFSTKNKHENQYKLTLKRKLIRKMNPTYKNILDFIGLIGFENVDVMQEFDEKTRRSKLILVVNNSSKVDWERTKKLILGHHPLF